MTKKIGLRSGVIHSISFGKLEIIEDCLIIFNSVDGIILNVVPYSKDLKLLQDLDQLIDYSGKFIIPGFVDAHCHAPQYVFTGTGMDLPLLMWLEKYTFPCESKFADLKFARLAYSKSIRRHLKSGTTFASYFATLHNEASKVLVDVINSVGQRAFVGKVSMDRNSPDFYIEDTTKGCDDAEVFVKYVLSQTEVGSKFLNKIESMANGLPGMFHELKGLMSKRSRNSLADLAYTSMDTSRTQSDRVRTISFASSCNDFMCDLTTLNSRLMDHTKADEADGQSQLINHVKVDEDEGYSEYCNTEDVETIGEPSHRERSLSLATIESNTTSSQMMLSSRVSNATINLWQQPSELLKRPRTISMDSITSYPIHSEVPVTSLLDQPSTPLVMPCITPRFVPTCTAEMMSRLGNISKKYGLPVQSHLSESMGEIEWVASLHPDCDTYASVYEKYGLLHASSYYAHCCHSSKAERAILAKNQAGVVHCASSNFNLTSGIMNVKQFVSEGLKVGLGTDVAGGYSASMLDAIRQTIIAARVLEIAEKNKVSSASESTEVVATTTDSCDTSEQGISTPRTDDSTSDQQLEKTAAGSLNTTNTSCLTYQEAFHLATQGGAEVLKMGNVVGNFLPGKKLDCLVVNIRCVNSPIDTFGHEGISEDFQKFLFLGDDRNIECVYVNGRKVI